MLQIIINSILTILLPVFIGLAIIGERTLAQRLPDHQSPRLLEFARTAVQAVEYAQSNSDEQHKREVASSFVKLFFEEWHIPVPSDAIIDIAVESALYEMRGNNVHL